MSHTHLSINERNRIEIYLELGYSYRKIAKTLNRNHTTISREIKRNQGVNVYSATVANAKSQYRKQNCGRHYKLNDLLQQRIIGRLEEKWSPEQIVYAELNQCISVQSIYNWIHKGFLKHSMKRLRHKGKYTRNEKRGSLKDFKPISERPDTVNDRTEIGHYEIDTVVSPRGKDKTCFLTLTERKSRLQCAFKMANREAETVRTTLVKLPQFMKESIKTITSDRGKEFACFKEIELDLNIDFYFADPYAPYQRGTNENANGLLREYYPKGTHLSEINEDELICNLLELNQRPRKCLNWRSPLDVFYEEVVHLNL